MSYRSYKKSGFTPLEFFKNFIGAKKTNQKTLTGFTLIELLVVISIIGLLATIVMVSLNTARTKSRDAKRVTDVRQITTALELYYDKYSYYPSYTVLTAFCNTDSPVNSLQALVTEGLLKANPLDPSNNSSVAPHLCYAYNSGAVGSEWYCAGRPRTDYQYSFIFSTELANLAYPRVTNSSGIPLLDFKYCVFGPLK